ncbi:MAG TPA: arylsulfotransferase family protein [Gaiellaceae bacterium]|nr:arylsulfotransferase family protein [Gaiellaceae bacterium]
MRQAHTRRQFLASAAAGAAALALPRAAWPRVEADNGFATFHSEPSLKPPTMTVNARTAPSPGYVFVTTLTGPGQRGPMIVDDAGRVVWFRRTSEVAIDFRVQRYRGKPVLTWWEGTIDPRGYGRGVGLVVDRSYRTVATVRAGNGYAADVHELLLTPQGTALITVYDEKTADLSSVGGPSSHSVLDSIVQEVDVASGKVLFEWHSLDHVPFADSFSPILDPFDYFHVNSIDVDLDGNLIVSARNTWGVYKLDRKTGAVLWTLGGRSSDFTLPADAVFMYQHDARAHADGTITLFDDGNGSAEHPARAIRIGYDLTTRQVTLLQQYPHPKPLLVAAMGNAQVLPDDGMFVGWGTQPYVTEFGPLGDVRWDASFDGGAWNYRAFRNTWTGRPATRPALAVKGRTAYVSWNGSTETAWWRLAAGAAEHLLAPVATARATPFETAIPLHGSPRWISATALDARKRPLASSRTIRVHP